MKKNKPDDPYRNAEGAQNCLRLFFNALGIAALTMVVLLGITYGGCALVGTIQ